MTNQKAIKGFKVFNPRWTCNGFGYEVGKTYEEKVDPVVHRTGFEFYREVKDCFNYYDFDPRNKVAEIAVLGKVAEGPIQCSTNKIQIVKELSWQELLDILNNGKGNAGYLNNGDKNSGNRNNGDWNSGVINDGSENSGDLNFGNKNSGDFNFGDYNSGDWNRGDGNSGYWNNEHRNTGNWNQASFCTGDFNLADRQTGCFCTEEPTIKFFDQDTGMTFKEWRKSKAYEILSSMPFEPTVWIGKEEMTDEEKILYPEYKTREGYLKTFDADESSQRWWDLLDDEEQAIIKSIPNFDSAKFYAITKVNTSKK